jgi:hypothetical protein
MNDLVRSYGSLSTAELDWLHLLVSEWQLLADLSFADLVLWLPSGPDQYVAVRPRTRTTWSASS